MAPETFITLLKDPAHWEFEVFLMFLQDVILGLLIVPLVRRHWKKFHGEVAPESVQSEPAPYNTPNDSFLYQYFVGLNLLEHVDVLAERLREKIGELYT